MKKLLFVIPEYSHGGTNKSLENLLRFLDKEKYDISIYCLYEDGEDYYKKVFAPYILKKSRLYYWLHDNKLTRKVMGAVNKWTKRNHFTFLYKREAWLLEKGHCFDIVVAYQEGTATQFVSYFKYTKSIAWIHCDYGNRCRGVRIREGEIYSHYDNIICVSETARRSLLSLYPEFEGKTWSIYNLLNKEEICHRAGFADGEEYLPDDSFTLVSIGRLSNEKQFEKIPETVSRLKGLTSKSFRWLIIGSGDREETIQAEIKKYHIEEKVILLGAKDNPYPYIKQVDLVVCTSESESFSYVIAEAKVLHTPVLSNDFPVAYEVVDERMGWIANIRDMPQLLAKIINNENEEYAKKKKSAIQFEYSNEQIIHKISQLFQASFAKVKA